MTHPQSTIVIHPLAGVNNTLYIGSAPDMDIRVVGDEGVSPRHAKVKRAVHRNPVNGCPGISEISDLGSEMGTWIRRNGVKLRVLPNSFVTLRWGDVIEIGHTQLPWSGAADLLP